MTLVSRCFQVSADADPTYVVRHAQLIFRGVGVSQLFVQLDYEHSNKTYANLQSFEPGHGHSHNHHQH